MRRRSSLPKGIRSYGGKSPYGCLGDGGTPVGYDMTWRETDTAGPERYFYASISDMGTLRRAMLELGMGYDEYSEVGDNPHPWPDSSGETFEQEPAEPGDAACPCCDLELIDGVCKACEADERWDAAAVPRRSWAPTPWLGICLRKLLGNDGYIVTAEECRAAVEAYDAATVRQRSDGIRAAAVPDPDPDYDEKLLEEVVAGLHPHAKKTRVNKKKLAAWFTTWVEFLRGAAEHGGFDVG